MRPPNFSLAASILRDIHIRPCTKSKLHRPTSSRITIRPIATTPRATATHRDPGPSSLLNEALDRRQGTTRNQDSVGPFQIGIGEQAYRNGVQEKKWKELSGKGKVMRATSRTTSFTVILLGAGLTAVLIYAVTSELFAKNSPTVLFNDACERIKASPEVAKHLHFPLTFHNNPPSATRPRHRNHHVASQIAIDSAGHEHMMLTFYIHAPSKSSSTSSSDTSYLDRITAFSSMSAEEVFEWSKATYESATRKAKRAFLYLVGDSFPSEASAQRAATSGRRETQIGTETKDKQSGVWGFAGLFSGLLRTKKKGSGSRGAVNGDDDMWEEGEVHADLIKNAEGSFVWRHIFIDLPNSRQRAKRIYVERAS